MSNAREALRTRCATLIADLANGQRDDTRRDALLTELARYQAAHVAPYSRLCTARNVDLPSAPLDAFPALPTDVYRFTRVSSRPADEDVRVFRSSGTTQQERSLHPFADLQLYDQAAEAAARYALFPDVERMPLILLAPDEREKPDSSLSYMLARFGQWFGTAHYVWRDDGLRIEALCRALEDAREPVALLGTSFAFVHALDALGDRRFALPARSRLMQTGGFKGRSREVEANELRGALCQTFGIPEPWIIAEYGMTELSSQLYETTLREAALGLPSSPRRLWVPGWVRAQPVHPEQLDPADDVGILRVDDCANLDSVACVQTSDLARAHGDRIELLGRAPGATPRGCSLSADQALGPGS